MNRPSLEAFQDMLAVFQKHGDDACFRVLVEAIESCSGLAATPAVEREIFESASRLSGTLGQIQVVLGDLVTFADAIEVCIDIFEEEENPRMMNERLIQEALAAFEKVLDASSTAREVNEWGRLRSELTPEERAELNKRMSALLAERTK